MCKYTYYNQKYTVYTDIKNYVLFLLKNFFINIQTNVRSTRTHRLSDRREERAKNGRYFISNAVDSLKKVL